MRLPVPSPVPATRAAMQAPRTRGSVRRSRALGAAFLLGAVLPLTGCESDEDRAQVHYERAQELLAAGDPERAALEFRNVFRLDGGHVVARADYARMLRETGDARGAFAQYLRLIEQDPRNLEGLRALAEMSVETGDFESAARHAEAAFALDPADPVIRALKATVDYAGGEREAAVALAQAVVAEAPATVAAQMVLIADQMNAGDPDGALDRIDAALTVLPGDEGLHVMRLSALEALGEDAQIGQALVEMADAFPDNPEITRALVQWHLRAGAPDAAEAVLRAEAARMPADPKAALEVVQFLSEIEGPQAARAELDRLIGADPDTAPRAFLKARAGLDFAQGRTAEAIAALDVLVADADPSDETRTLQTALAEMYDATGDAAARDALIERVLGEDPGHVPALKLRARGHIAADRPDRAIQDMRTALNQAPRDPEIMTILALAHEREGARELAGERLALAVETSEGGVDESLRYAQFLMRDARAGPAEGVVADALRRHPGTPDLLAMLGRIHLERRDWPRVRQVVEELRRSAGPDAGSDAAGTGDPAVEAMATDLEIAALRGETAPEQTIAALEARAAQDGAPQALADLVRAHAEAGDLETAQDRLDLLRAADPANPQAKMLQAGLQTLRGETEAAEESWRAVIAEDPAQAGPHLALFALKRDTGRAEAALEALDAGIEATDGAAELLMAKAGFLESRGNIDGAIAAYETLYARDSASSIVANNLASLIAGRSIAPVSAPADGDADPADRAAEVDPAVRAAEIERAFTIARRLRGSDVPQFQDTYGWIAHLRGDGETAREALEPAAEALPLDPLVQFHLAEVLRAAGETEAARDRYAHAIAVAEALPPEAVPQIETIRARLAEMEAGGTPADPAPEPAQDG